MQRVYKENEWGKVSKRIVTNKSSQKWVAMVEGDEIWVRVMKNSQI